jgi:predicted RNA-binding protein YlqC (UPF0109 family)
MLPFRRICVADCAGNAMKDLLEYIARNLVDNPEAVQIRERVGRFTVTYELSVHPDETGKVIGRSGRVAKAIRDVMSIAAARQNKRVHIDIE